MVRARLRGVAHCDRQWSRLPKSAKLRVVRPLLATIVALLLLQSASPASARCALIGDSIAEDLRPFLRECGFSGRLGIGTAAIIPLVPSDADVIIVSAGSNDYLTPGLLGRMQALRARVGSAQVIWIRPIPQIAATAVDSVAQAHGDAVVPFVVSRTDRERLHPQSNDTLAADIRKRFTADAAPQNLPRDEKSSSESSLNPRTVGDARMSHDDRSHNRHRRLLAARSASAIGAHYRRK